MRFAKAAGAADNGPLAGTNPQHGPGGSAAGAAKSSVAVPAGRASFFLKASDNRAQQFPDTGSEGHRQRAPEYHPDCATQNVCTSYSGANRAEKCEEAQ